MYYPPQNYFPNSISQRITEVNGENGARAYQIGANSSVILLDTSEPIIWIVQTDGAGYKTVTPYDITPHIPKEQVALDSIEQRLKKLEEMYNVKSDTEE